MAKLVPSRSSCLPRMTGGEKRVSERLEQKLEDDYLLWYDVPIGLKQRQPDFVVFHPRRGGGCAGCPPSCRGSSPRSARAR